MYLWNVELIIQSWTFNCDFPTQQTINNLINKVKETCYVKHKQRIGKLKTEDTYENHIMIIKYNEKFRNASIKEFSIDLILNNSFIERVLNTSGYHTYKFSQVPFLKNEHKIQYKTFVYWYLKLKNQTCNGIFDFLLLI